MRSNASEAMTLRIVIWRLISDSAAILGLGVFLLLTMGGSVEARTLLWAKRAGGVGDNGGSGIAVDSSGNSYATGYFDGSATFGAGETNQTTLTSAGNSDMFVAKYSSSGALQWAKRAGGTDFDEGLGIGVDGSGNSYVTGYFEGSATFGQGEANQTTLTAAGGSFDVFVAKYNSNGALQWVKRAGGTVDEAGYGIAVDGSGNSYVTGYFEGSATFGQGEANQTTLIAVGGSETFVAKYNSSGALQWAKRAGGTDFEAGYGIAVDGSGNSYVTGYFEGSATFGQGEANQTTLTSAGGSDMFVAKYSSSGALQWAKRAGGTSFIEGYGIRVDGSGNSYVVGSFVGSVTFGQGEANQTILAFDGGVDIFVAKYNSSGALQWAKRASGTGFDEGYGIGVDGSGNSYVTGYFDGSATFGAGEANQTTLTSAGGFEIFVAKYNSSGALQWAKRAGGTDLELGVGIGVDSSGSSYVTGYFAGAATFGSGQANQTILTSAGGYDAFVAKFSGYKRASDFDRDGISDMAVYQTSTGNWFYVRSMAGFGHHLNLGGANFLPVPGDYDGDGETDEAVYDTTNGYWFIAQSMAGFRIHPTFGGAGFIPVPGDYDGDGKTDVAVYQTSTGHWFMVRSTLGFTGHLAFGGSGFIPVPGDYDGDGKTDVAVHQTSTGHWFIAQSTAGFRSHLSFGGSGFIPVPGDYDADGKMDVGVYQSSTGHWFAVGSTDGFLQHLNFGGPGFLPVPGDYDGDGETDTAVYQTSTGHWFIDQSTAGFRSHLSFGGAGFVPVLPQVTILRALGLL